MRKIILSVVLAVSFSVVTVASATALTWQGHTAYVLKNHKAKCATDYHRETIRVKGKRTVGCVYLRPVVKGIQVVPVVTTVTNSPTPTTLPSAPTTTTTPPTPTFTYKAHTDPSFTQSASNPKAVTYTYTGDATETLNGKTTDLAQTGQLPAGILELFSDGSLICSVNVGAATTGGKCSLTYSAYGVHSVVVDYIPSGVAPTTETDPEDIEPFGTSTAVSTSFIGATADISNFTYQTVSVPVTVSGLTASLGTTGTVSLTNTDAVNESCQPLTYSASLGSASATCTAQIENDPNVTVPWTPTVTFSGDGNYSSSGASGQVVTIPVAPAPTINNVSVTLTCAESGGFCSEYQSAPETTDARANVDAGFDTSPQIGTVTFTSSDHLLICTATVFSAADLASNNARCTGQGGPFSGPIQVNYSGGTIETGDTVETIYGAAHTVGGSN